MIHSETLSQKQTTKKKYCVLNRYELFLSLISKQNRQLFTQLLRFIGHSQSARDKLKYRREAGYRGTKLYSPALESWSRTGCEASPGCVVRPCIKKPREEGGRKRGVREGTREERRLYGISLQPLRTWTFVDFGNSSWNKFPKDIKWQQYTLIYFFIDQLMNTGLFPSLDCCDHTAAQAGMWRPLRLISFCLAISPG